MALEGIVLNEGTGGQKLATDTVGGFDFQIIKIGVGADDSTPTSVSDANPMPVDDAGGSLTVDNGGTFVVQEDGAALTALQLIDNIVHVDDAAFTPGTDSVAAVGALFDDTAPDSVDEGDAGILRMSANRNLYSTLRDAAGNERGVNVDASNRLTVSVDNTVTVGSHAVTNAGTFVVQEDGAALAALQLIDDVVHIDDTATHATGTTKGALIMAAATPTDGSVDANDIGAVAMSLDRRLHVDSQIVGTDAALDVSAATVTVDGTGTFVVQEDGAALTALQLIDNIVQVEDAVHGTGDSGVMSLAVRNDVLASLVDTDGDYAPLQVNASGALFIQEGAALDVSAATLTVNAHAVTNAGTFVVQEDGAALTALQLIDDVVFAEDTAHSTGAFGNLVLGVRRDADTSPVDATADYHALIFDATGNLKVNVKAGSAGGTEFNEDSAHSSGAAGTLSLGVRRDADTSPVTTDLDYHTMIFDNAGNLKVNVKTGAAGGVTHTDDAVFTAGTDDVVPAAGFFNDSTPDSVDEGDAGVLRMSANRNLYATLRDAAGNERGVNVDASNRLTVSVDNNPVLGAGTNGIGKLTANSGVDIGDVDILSVTPGTAANNLGKTEDTAHSSLDVGVMALVVRRDADTTLVNLDGDYAPLQVDANGKLKVEIFDGGDSLTVTNAGTFVVQEDGAALTALQLIDDPVFADNAAFALTTDKVMMSGVIVDAALSALAAVDGDAVPMRVNANGALHVTGSAGVTEFNEDTASAGGEAGNVSLGVRRDADTSPVSADNDYHTMIFDATGSLKVNVKSSASHAVTNAGTFVVQEDGAALTALQLIDDIVHVDDTATHSTGSTKGALIMAAATPTDGSVDANDIGSVAMSVDRRLHVDAQIVGTDAALDVSAATVTVDGTGTFATQATLQTGSNAIGKLTANSGVDIGDVDIIGGVNGTASGALGAENDAVTLSSQGVGTVHWEIDTGTLVGTVSFEATLDDTNWFGVNIIRINGGIVASTSSFADRGTFASAGFSQVRLRVSSFTSGTSNARMEGSLFHSSVVRLGQALPGGTNAIGKLAANSGVDIGDVDVTSQPARASTTDSIKAVLATDTVMDGTTAEVPIFKAFDVSSSGDNEIVALVSSNKIRVLSLALNAFGDVEAEFQSGGTTTNLSGTFDLGTSAGKAKGLVLAFSPIGHFESASGTALDLNLNAAVQVSGHVVYIVVAG